MRKSGNDLWKAWIGSSLLVGNRRTEWREWRVVEISDLLRRVESTFIGRGLSARRTIPTTDLK